MSKFRKKPVVIEAIEVKDLVAEFFQRKATLRGVNWYLQNAARAVLPSEET